MESYVFEPKQDDVKRAARGYQHWLGTWNNYPEDWMFQLTKVNATFFAANREIAPTTNTPHIQFYLWFEKPVEKSSLQKKLSKCWIRGKLPEGAQQCYDYCTPNKCGNAEDQKTVVEGSHVEWGRKPNFKAVAAHTKKTQGQAYEESLDHCKAGDWTNAHAEHQVKYYGNLTKLTAFYAKGEDRGHPRGIWITGPPGSGKSYFARTNWGPLFYLKPQNKWWDNYNGEPVAILDDLDQHGSCLSHHLKIWADQYSFKGEIKGGSTTVNYDYFIITSNYTPDELWPGDANVALRDAIRRRFKFIHMEQRQVVKEEYFCSCHAKEDPYIGNLMSFLNK